jgi:hypothetical protein
LTLVFASCLIRQPYFAGIAKIGKVTFDARLNAALASLGVCAKLFHVSRTGFGIDSLEHHRLVIGQVLEVRLEARPDLASPRLHPCAKCFGILQASARECCRRHGAGEQQHGGKSEKASDSDKARTCGL